MGGTRFVGRPLVQKLLLKGHQITLFTRGKNPIPENVESLIGDRLKSDDLRKLKGRSFDVIIDTSGRQLSDTKNLIEITGLPEFRFLYLSSAGIYCQSNEWPLDENSPIDPKSRHIGKVETENWLKLQNIPFTSFRPTYIYGPGNYNPIEKWFFDRITYKRPIPIPGDGNYITQLGHVEDLTDAIASSLDYEIANKKIYNCSNTTGITFNGILQSAAKVCGHNLSDIKINYFDPIKLNSKSRKAFPLRIGHFFTSNQLIQNELNWFPNFDILSGLKDSYTNEYILNSNNEPNFTNDDSLLY